MKKHLLSQLRDLRDNSTEINPSKEWVASNREQLISQISNTVSNNTNNSFSVKAQQIFRIFVPVKQLHAVRGVFVFMLIFGVATSGLVASASPLPRDILFNVKIAAATVTGNTEAKGKLHIEEAKHQTQELQRKLAVVDPTNTQEKKQRDVEKQLNKIKKQVDSAKKTLEKAVISKSEGAAMLAKELTIETTSISESLKSVTEKVAEESGNKEDKQDKKDGETLNQEVAEVRKGIVNIGIDALEVLITPSSNNISEADKESINTVVKEVITEILEEAEDVKKVVAETKEQADLYKENQSSATNTVAEVIGTSTVATSTISTTNTIFEEIKFLEEKSSKTEEMASKVKILMEEQQVNEAVSYLKELSQSTLDTKEAVMATKQIIEQKEAEKIVEEQTEKDNASKPVSSTVESSTPTEAVIEEKRNGTTTDSSL